MSLKRRKNYGWMPSLPDPRDRLLHPFGAPRAGAVVLPPRVDLSDRHRFTILDQGELGACVAHAVAGAVEYAHATRQNMTSSMRAEAKNPISRLFIYYEARAIIGTTGEDSGCYTRDALRVAYNLGAPREQGWKYNVGLFTAKPPKSSYRSALYHKITSYRAVEVNTLAIKDALAGGLPVVAGVCVFDGFENAANGDVPMPRTNDEFLGGHAILLCGYDDATQRFKFVNSWSEAWGTRGYGTLPYDYAGNPDLGDDYWVMTDELYKERM